MKLRVPVSRSCPYTRTRFLGGSQKCGFRVPVPVSVGHGDTVHTAYLLDAPKQNTKEHPCPSHVPIRTGSL